MARGHHHVIGLDIGAHSIKAVELQRAGGGAQVVGRPMIVPTPERAVEGGVIVDQAAVAQAIQELVAAAGFRTKKVVTSVGGESSVVVRITEVPRMTGKELEEAVQWELDRQTPFPVDQSSYDYKVIEPPDADPNAQNIDVLIAVAQDDMIDAHVDSIMSAKLVPVAIDVDPLAISRSVVNLEEGTLADQTVGIVHIGASSTMILVVRKGLLSFVRQVPTAGNALTQAIRQSFMGDEKLSEQAKRALSDLSDAMYDEDGQYIGAEGYEGEEEPDDVLGADDADSVFELSDSEAESLADQPLGDAEAAATQLDVLGADEAPLPAGGGQAPAGAGHQASVERSDAEAVAVETVYEAIAPPLVDLANEVRRSIDFYRRQHRNEEVDRLVLSGGSGVIRGLDTFIENDMGITTVLANPFAHLVSDEEETAAEYLRDIGPAMTVAVGLALRDMLD